MAEVIFYEKPGCINNRKQKRLLQEAGHSVDARNLLTADWSPDSLRPYLGTDVSGWINKSHPDLKAGKLALDLNDPQAVLALLCADPLLIRRPLMEVSGQCLQGFDTEQIDRLIGLERLPDEDIETCPKSHGSDACRAESG
ncbi:ArsC/Spx/MgsR family protein [Marinobacterium mangrovicola]|uniref:Nitrogenase-associated protein n=1 Tax=Marinobacterium mangrovicola TaxID=1476959 RepID=A0A4R1GML2_9GAMM|nr:ArsC/Spx/MgsR family protein [Marinobacterium mangrovicola]TCK08340.1 nitrogenase-associated protein [Marinobacterium mangrovicola]